MSRHAGTEQGLSHHNAPLARTGETNENTSRPATNTTYQPP